MHTVQICGTWIKQYKNKEECNREIGIEYVVDTLGNYYKEAQCNQHIGKSSQNSPQEKI